MAQNDLKYNNDYRTINIQGESSESITSNNSFGWPGIEKSFI